MKFRNRIRKILRRAICNNTRNVEIVREIDYCTLENMINNNIDMVLVDIRSPQEYREGKIKNAINIPLYELNKKDSVLLLDKDRLIILYCACGVRSKKAYKLLEEKGYTNLYSLKGGIDAIA